MSDRSRRVVSRAGAMARGGGPAGAGIAVYAVLSWVLLGPEAGRMSLDLTKYIQVALCLAEGNFAEGISTYWSPLLSWGIAGLYRMGVDPLYAAKAVLLAGGALFLLGIDVLARVRMSVPAGWRLVVAVGLAPAVARAAVLDLTPDILLAAALTGYLVVALDPRLPERRYAPLLAGALGGIAYLAKAYGFPFFAAHWTAVFGVRALRGRSPRSLVRPWALGVVGCLAVAGPQLATISWMAGRPTLSEAGWQARMLATQRAGFVALREDAVADRLPRPGLLVPDVDRLSRDEAASLGPAPPLGAGIWDGALHVARELRQTDALGLGLVCLLIAPLIAAGGERAREPWLLLLLTVAIYAAGYVPLYVESRYLMPFLKGLMAVALVFVIGSATDRFAAGRAWLAGLAGILAVIALCTSDLRDLADRLDAHQGSHPWRRIEMLVARRGLAVATVVSDDRRVGAFTAVALHRPCFCRRDASWEDCLPGLSAQGGVLAVLRSPDQARRLASHHQARLVGACWRADPYTSGEPIWILHIP